MLDWQKRHGEVISDFLAYLNKSSNDYVLKGGTALMSCYNLDRFSEDIDLDSTNKKSIKTIVDNFCKERGYGVRVAKDTDTVKRFMINYGNVGKPLKVEISYRNREIDQDRVTKINDITVYDIDRIARMKSNAYNARDKIRDLYDVTFICRTYYEQLTNDTKETIKDALQYKGLYQFDSMIATQSDELIDNDKLANDFLDVFDRLGLMYDAPCLEDELDYSPDIGDDDGIDFER